MKLLKLIMSSEGCMQHAQMEELEPISQAYIHPPWINAEDKDMHVRVKIG